MTGVIDYVSAADIPGLNSVWGYEETRPDSITEEIFSTGQLYYAGQPIGLIIADTYEHAKYK